MYNVHADVARNRLYVALEGFLTDETAKEAADQIIAEMDKLRPGFDVINDIANFKPMTPEGARQIARAHEALHRHGFGRIIRISGEQVIGTMQFQRVSQQNKVDSEYVTSLAEAERLLDG